MLPFESLESAVRPEVLGRRKIITVLLIHLFLLLIVELGATVWALVLLRGFCCFGCCSLCCLGWTIQTISFESKHAIWGLYCCNLMICCLHWHWRTCTARFGKFGKVASIQPSSICLPVPVPINAKPIWSFLAWGCVNAESTTVSTTDKNHGSLQSSRAFSGGHGTTNGLKGPHTMISATREFEIDSRHQWQRLAVRVGVGDDKALFPFPNKFTCVPSPQISKPVDANEICCPPEMATIK